jgi:hypothetical protein
MQEMKKKLDAQPSNKRINPSRKKSPMRIRKAKKKTLTKRRTRSRRSNGLPTSPIH